MAAPLFGFCVRSHSMVKDSSSHNKYAVQSSCGTQQQDTTDARGSPSRYSDVSRPTSTTQPIQHMTTRHIDSARHERGSRSNPQHRRAHRRACLQIACKSPSYPSKFPTDAYVHEVERRSPPKPSEAVRSRPKMAADHGSGEGHASSASVAAAYGEGGVGPR